MYIFVNTVILVVLGIFEVGSVVLFVLAGLKPQSS
jgi:hypothetical protein